MARWTLSTPIKVALPCLALGIIFFLVAFSVNHWVTVDIKDVEINGGLWKACIEQNGVTACGGWADDSLKSVERDWFHKNQALQCLALILLMGSVGSLVTFLLTRLKAAMVTSFVTCFMAAFFVVLGCALFASDMNSDKLYSTYGKIGWAFGFAVVAAILLIAGGVSLILHVFFATSVTTTTTSSSSNPTNLPTVA